MDESVINGANLFFAPQFGIPQGNDATSRNAWLLCLVNSAPYVCALNEYSLCFCELTNFAAVLWSGQLLVDCTT